MSDPEVKHPLVQLIDKEIERRAPIDEFPFRAHLGGSMIGRKCERQIWYGFRWAKAPAFSGRILRLFNRGHLEEFRFVKFLRNIGVEVREYATLLCYHAGSDSYMKFDWNDPSSLDPEFEDVTDSEAHIQRAKTFGVKLKQWRISDFGGHFGGSLDGLMRVSGDVLARLIEISPPPVAIDPNEDILAEFKTHNTKSFCKLVEVGVEAAKPEHYAQMQIYMLKKNLRLAFYLAVNKNDDDLHGEWVVFNRDAAEKMLAKAERIIRSTAVPNRLHGASPAWFDCKFCDYSKICHLGEPPDRNCRTCANSIPVEEGQWRCNHWGAIIPQPDSDIDAVRYAAIMAGCDAYKPIRD